MVGCGVSFRSAHCNWNWRRPREGGAPKMVHRDPERYTQGDDGLIVEKVGSWDVDKLKRIDVIAHVSLSDLQRNADRYTHEAHDQFDKFAPGWRDKVSTDMNQNAFRAAHPILVRQGLAA